MARRPHARGAAPLNLKLRLDNQRGAWPGPARRRFRAAGRIIAAKKSPARRERGQALVEFAILTPVLLPFVLLTVDVGRAYWQAINGAGAAWAGVRMGVISDTSDIGSAVRDEPNSGIANTVAAWGTDGPGTT